MKAVVIISMADLYFGSSAATVRVNNYARSLSLSGVNVILLSTYMEVSVETLCEIEPQIFVCKRLKKSIKPFNLFGLMKFVSSCKKLITHKNFDYSVLNYSCSFSLLLDILLLFRKKQKVFCEVNEVRKFASERKGNIIDNLYCYLLERTYPKYDGLVFISSNIKKYYSSLAKKSIIIPILSDCNMEFVPHIHENGLKIVFFGSISFAKENIDELLKGFLLFVKDNPKAELLLYGNADEKNKVLLEKFISENKVCRHIMYFGPLSHYEVYEKMTQADILVLPRNNNKQNYYGFSTKLSEYAVSGVPIVMTDTGVVSDYFKDGISCIICKGYDSVAIKNGFEEIARMSVFEREEMVKNSFAVAKKNFDYRKYSEKLCSFLIG